MRTQKTKHSSQSLCMIKKGVMFNDFANFSSNTAIANENGIYTISFGCGGAASKKLETANAARVFNVSIRHYQPTGKVSVDDCRTLPMLPVIKIENNLIHVNQ